MFRGPFFNNLGQFNTWLVMKLFVREGLLSCHLSMVKLQMREMLMLVNKFFCQLSVWSEISGYLQFALAYLNKMPQGLQRMNDLRRL